MTIDRFSSFSRALDKREYLVITEWLFYLFLIDVTTYIFVLNWQKLSLITIKYFLLSRALFLYKIILCIFIKTAGW